MSNNHELSNEFRETAERLRSDRPELDAHGLDRVHRRVVGRALRPARRSRQSLALTLCVALGLVFTGAGSGLAVSGLSSDQAASQMEAGVQQVGGDQAQGGTIGGPSAPGGDQAVRQVEAVGSAGKLPFTGAASLLILGLGGGLLVTGAVLRWRTMRGDYH